MIETNNGINIIDTWINTSTTKVSWILFSSVPETAATQDW